MVFSSSAASFWGFFCFCFFYIDFLFGVFFWYQSAFSSAERGLSLPIVLTYGQKLSNILVSFASENGRVIRGTSRACGTLLVG